MLKKVEVRSLKTMFCLAIMLTSCVAEGTPTPTMLLITPFAQPTTTITAISTIRAVNTTAASEPSNTPRPTRTPAPTPTFFITSTSEIKATLSFDELPPLSDTVVTNVDFRPEFFPFPHILIQEPIPTQVDATSELAEQCSKDCIKKVWVVDDYSRLTLIMIRTPSASQAVNAVAYQWKIFTANEDEIIETLNDFSGTPDSDWLTYKWKDWAFASSRGPVFLLLLWHINWEGDIDGYWTAVELAALGQLQLQKLAEAGYPP